MVAAGALAAIALAAIALAAMALAAAPPGGAEARAQDPDEPIVDGAVQVTPTPAAARGHAVPDLAVHPDDPRTLAIVEGEAYSARCTLRVSTDAGLSWSARPWPEPEEWPECMYATFGPVADVEFAADGTLVLAHSGHDPETYRSRVFVSRSTDLGSSWETTAAPWVEPDLDAGEFGADSLPTLTTHPDDPEQLYVGWMSNNGTWNLSEDVLEGNEYYTDIRSRAYLAVSDDGGETFEGPVDLAGEEDGWFNQPHVAIDGDDGIHAFFGDNTRPPEDAPDDAEGPPANVWHAVSRDGGESFEQQAVHTREPKEGGDWLTAPTPAVGPRSGDLYLVWEEAPKDGVPFVAFVRSTDGGRTWSEPRQLNDADAEREWSFNEFFPSIAVAPGGRIDVAWYDWRDDPAFDPDEGSNAFQHVYATYSEDGGDSWAPNYRVTDRAIDRRLGVGSASYGVKGPIGLAAADTATYVAWDDTRNADEDSEAQDIYFTRARHAPASDVFGSGRETPAPAMWSGLGAGGALAVGGVALLLGMALARRSPDRSPGA